MNIKPDEAYCVLDKLATKLEELGLLPADATYEEFETVVNQMLRSARDVVGGSE